MCELQLYKGAVGSAVSPFGPPPLSGLGPRGAAWKYPVMVFGLPAAAAAAATAGHCCRSPCCSRASTAAPVVGAPGPSTFSRPAPRATAFASTAC